MPISVHDVDLDSDELVEWFGVIRLVFKDHHGRVAQEFAADRLPSYRGTRVTAARQDGELVGTYRSWDTELTVPGGSLTADAISAVAVLPTHRRQGVMSALIGRDLTAAAERGAPVAVLIASEATIYGRFGFGPSTETADVAVDLSRAAMPDRGMAGAEGRSTIRIVPPERLRPVAPDLYRASRQPGDVDRLDPWWDSRLGITRVEGLTDQGVVTVLATDPVGQPVGYLRYSAENDWRDRVCHTVVEVRDLRAVTPQAYADLWRYLIELDGVATVRAAERPVDEYLSLLLQDPRAARQASRCDFLWSRVLDPAAVLTARSYDCDGEVTLRVVDPGGPADGSFRLQVHQGRAECTRTGRPAEVDVPVDVLGSLWLGGGELRHYQRAGRAGELVPGALDRLAAMLRTRSAPWSSTWF
jgi:predicted acetyltransferase